MPTVNEAYLSIVVTARNDDHGGNLLDRMQAFVNGWIGQARRHNISSELIIVEWNPPSDRPRLAEALAWPEDPGPCQIRIIEVPNELHRRLTHAAALPLYQMIGKNVGIRRARGQFILATNIDILFSSELAAYLASKQLKPGRMYRIDRHDVMSNVPANGSVEEQLEYCRTHLVRVNVREGTYPISPNGQTILCPGDIASADSGILFGRDWFPLDRLPFQKPFRWAGQQAELLIRNPLGKALLIDLEPGPGAGNAPLDLGVMSESNKVLAQVSIKRRCRLRIPIPPLEPCQASTYTRIFFRVRGKGITIDGDPRILSFRAFQVKWDFRNNSFALKPSGARELVPALWCGLQHLVKRLATGGPLVRITVPVSSRVHRRLKAYIEWQGLSGMTRNILPYLRRRMSLHARTPAGKDIFAACSGLSPGAGWQRLTDYRGESFRKAKNGAELIVSDWAADATELGMQIEPAKDPVDLVLLDAEDKPIVKERVSGLSFLKFTVPRLTDRTRVFRFGLSGELKIYWCGWTRRTTPPQQLRAWALPWGAGWQWNPAAGAMTSDGTAELIITTPDSEAAPLFIELEASPPIELNVGTAWVHVNERAVHRLDLALEPGRTHVLEVTGSGPFRAYGCDWNETPGADNANFVHTNACGDFTLMAREHWFDLRGYPEFDQFSMNLDSLLCIAAHFGGIREQMLNEPMRIYHIEHGSGSGWTPEGQAKLYERIAAKGLSFVDNEQVLAWAAQMSRLKAPMIFNHENWGMAGVELKETVLLREQRAAQLQT